MMIYMMQELYPVVQSLSLTVAAESADGESVSERRRRPGLTSVPCCSQAGDKCMVLPSISEDDAKKLFPAGVEVHEVPSGKKYIRTTPQPQ